MVESLPYKHENLHLILRTHVKKELVMVMSTYKSITRKAETGGSL